MYDALDVPRMKREAEQKALRDERLQGFAIRIIDAGFKAQALKQFAAVQWPYTDKTWP